LNNKIKSFTVVILMLAILFGMTSCSSKNAECKVTLDRNGNLDIIVNPPGETGEASQKGTLQRNLLISPSKKVTNYVGTITKTYKDNDTEYKILVDISIENERLIAYELTVTGDVYGETPHICSYP
jgi:hypothetical protein